MAGLYWTAVTLAFFLCAANTADAVTPERLATIMNGIKNEYKTSGIYCLAVRIPDNNQNINQILQQVFNADPGNIVNNTINNGDVYIGNRVVAAKVSGVHHAESRVVDQLDHLFNNQNANDHDMLLFYVYASPCVERCSSDTHADSILSRINHIRQWNSYAVVFSKIFRPQNGPANTEEELRGALQRLGTYQGTRGSIGLENIFRCDRQNRWMQCTSCSNGNQVANYCVSD